MEGEYGLSWRVCGRGWNAGFDQRICSGFEMWERLNFLFLWEDKSDAWSSLGGGEKLLSALHRRCNTSWNRKQPKRHELNYTQIVRTITSLIHILYQIYFVHRTSHAYVHLCVSKGTKVNSLKSTLHLILSTSTSSLEYNHPDLSPPQNPRPNPPVLAAKLFALSSNPNPATFRTSSNTFRISSPSTTPSLFLSNISSTCFCNFS